MGQKVHPTSFRIGTIFEWRSQWYAEQNPPTGPTYAELVAEDIRLRNYINSRMSDAAIARIDIERNPALSVRLWTAKPGIVIGRGGQNVEELRRELSEVAGARLRVDVEEIPVPELDATLVARNVAEQLERRIAFRRAIKQAVQRTMQRGAEGAKIIISGRLGGAEMSRSAKEMSGRVPLHTLRADIDYGLAEARTVFGHIGVKVWIYKGERLPFKPETDDRESGGPGQAGPGAGPGIAPQPGRPGGEPRRNA